MKNKYCAVIFLYLKTFHDVCMQGMLDKSLKWSNYYLLRILRELEKLLLNGMPLILFLFFLKAIKSYRIGNKTE